MDTASDVQVLDDSVFIFSLRLEKYESSDYLSSCGKLYRRSALKPLCHGDGPTENKISSLSANLSFIIFNPGKIMIITIIMSGHEHRFPRHSLAIFLYCPSHSAGHLDYIRCLFKAVVDRFEPDVCVMGSTGERRLWPRFYFSSSSPLVLFVWFELFCRCEVGGCTAAVLRNFAIRICSIWLVAFLYNCCQAFYLYP